MALHLGLTGIKAVFTSLSTTAKVIAIVTTITITEATVFVIVKTINEQPASSQAQESNVLPETEQVDQPVDTVAQPDRQPTPTPVEIDNKTETVIAPDSKITETDTEKVEPKTDDQGVTELDGIVDIAPLPETLLKDKVTIPIRTEGRSSFKPES